MLPLDVLKNARNKKVVLHTSDQMRYIGYLNDFDVYANTILSNAEYQSLENKSYLGLCVVQGGTLSYIEIIE